MKNKKRALVLGNYIVFYASDSRLWIWSGNLRNYRLVDTLPELAKVGFRRLAIHHNI